jgi:hypothetical protein
MISNLLVYVFKINSVTIQDFSPLRLQFYYRHSLREVTVPLTRVIV